ncbi:AraC family transcriptional regulator [Gordonia soli]|uniref:Putative AraC family transcriptional regulator n=1 Tax=Gordonia soli NBRC 108243 TaxID=1223545 RepID=M0QQM3_9ACTN|nr:AraC family transcriptional regulator [Gordonia soli]GAC70556.1 putative AraC family transcriptional regulator [Gordonia soli NBRC 108243]
MDALGSLLNGPRAQQAMLLRMVMTEPWAVRIEDESPMTVVAVTRGTLLVTYDDGEHREITPGQVALFRGTHHYTIGDAVDSPLVAHIDARGDCYDPTGTYSVAEPMSLGVRSWGNATGETTADSVMLIGAYLLGEVGRRLLSALDRLTVVDLTDDPLIAMMELEIVRDAPAQEAVLNRLLDLILVTALRRSMESGQAQTPAWYAAHNDPIVGHALRLLHNNIERPWTVASLASATGVSRAVLARRFTELVGEPPMGYLANWRVSVASELLADSGSTLAAIAARVGYGTPFALSAAFKRHRGMSPADYRRGLAAV